MGFMEYETYDDTGHQIHETFANNEDSTFDVVDYGPRQLSGSLFNELESNLGDSLFDFNVEKLHIRNSLHPADRKLMKKAFNCLVISYHESVRDSVQDSLSLMYNRKHYINLAIRSFLLPTRKKRLKKLLNDAETYSLREFLYRWRLYILTINEVKSNEVKAKLFYESSLSSKFFKGFKYLIKQNNLKIYKLSRMVSIVENMIICNVLNPWNQMAKNQKRLELCQADIIKSHNSSVKQMAFNSMYKLYNYRVGVYILSDFTFYYLKKLAFCHLYQFCRQLLEKQVYLDKKIKLVWVEKFFEHWRFLSLYRNSTNYYNYKLKLKSFNRLKLYKTKKLLSKNKYALVKEEVDKCRLDKVLREMVKLYTYNKNRRNLIFKMTNVVDLYLKKKFYQILYENNKMIEYEMVNELKAEKFYKSNLFNKTINVLYEYKEYRRNKKSKLILASESYKRYLLSLVFDHLMGLYLDKEKKNLELVKEFRKNSDYRFLKLYFNSFRYTVNKVLRLTRSYDTIDKSYKCYLVNNVFKTLQNIIKENYRRKLSLISFIVKNSTNYEDSNMDVDVEEPNNLDEQDSVERVERYEEEQNETEKRKDKENKERCEKEKEEKYKNDLKLVNNSRLNVKLLLASTQPLKSESLVFLLHMLSLKSRFNEVYYCYYTNNEDELINKLLQLMSLEEINQIKSKYSMLLHETRLLYISNNKPYGKGVDEYFQKLPNEIVYLLQYLILDNIFKLSSLLKLDSNELEIELKNNQNKNKDNTLRRKETKETKYRKEREQLYEQREKRKDSKLDYRETKETKLQEQYEYSEEREELTLKQSEIEVNSYTLLNLPLWRLVNLKFMVGKKRKMLKYWRTSTENKIKKRERDSEYYENFLEMNKMFTKIRFFEEWYKLSSEVSNKRKQMLVDKYNQFYNHLSLLVNNRKALGYVYLHLNYLNCSFKGDECESRVRGWFTNFLMNNPEFNYSSLVFNYLKMKRIFVMWRNFSLWYYNVKRDAQDFNRINILVKSFKIWFTSTVYQNNQRDKLGQTIKETSDSVLKYVIFVEWFKVSKLNKMLDKKNYDKNLMIKTINHWKKYTELVQLEKRQYTTINDSWNKSLLDSYFSKWYNVLNYTLKDREMNEMADNYWYRSTLNKYLDKWVCMTKKQMHLNECVEKLEKANLDYLKRHYFGLLYKYWKLNSYHREVLVKNIFNSFKTFTFVSKVSKVIENRHVKYTKESVREFYNLIKQNYKFYLECEKIAKNKKTLYSILYRLSNINNDRILQGLRVLNTNAYYKTRFKLIRDKSNWLLMYQYFSKWKEVSSYNQYWVNRIEKVYTYLQEMDGYDVDRQESIFSNTDVIFGMFGNFGKSGKMSKNERMDGSDKMGVMNKSGNISKQDNEYKDKNNKNSKKGTKGKNDKYNKDEDYLKDYPSNLSSRNKYYQLKLIRTKYLMRLYPKVLRYWRDKCHVLNVSEEVMQDIKQFSLMNMVIETLRILHTNRLAVNCRKMLVNTANEISYKRNLKVKSQVFKYLRSLVGVPEYNLLSMEDYEGLLDYEEYDYNNEEYEKEKYYNHNREEKDNYNVKMMLDEEDQSNNTEYKDKENREKDNEYNTESNSNNNDNNSMSNDNNYPNKSNNMTMNDNILHRFYHTDTIYMEENTDSNSESSHVKIYNLDVEDQEVDSSREDQPTVYSLSIHGSLVNDNYLDIDQQVDNEEIIHVYNDNNQSNINNTYNNNKDNKDISYFYENNED